MGDAADDMLNGLTCEWCGSWIDDVIDGDPPIGVPTLCEYCKDHDEADENDDD